MTIEIRMPQLSADMTEADLLDWLVAPGDEVTAGEVILELETEKSTVEVESPATGTLTEIRVPAGSQAVPVGELLGLLEPAAEETQLEGASTSGVAAPPPAPAEPEPEAVIAAPTSPPDGEAPATALARRVAEQSGIALDAVAGTGARGRITRDDVERSLHPERPAPTTPAGATSGPGAGESIPHTRMRRTIAARLSAAKQEVPHFYLHVDCAAGAIQDARAAMNAHRGDAPVSLNDFVIRASALALVEVPAANASWTEDAIVRHASVDVSVAVATEGGLVTPIVRGADQKGLGEIADEMRDLAARARAGRLEPAEYQGGSFTVSNLGMYGVGSVYPIVNPPQSCILGVGAASERPVVQGGALAVGRVMTLTLSADHRVVDGAIGAQLLAAVRRRLEAPLDMML